MIFKQMRPLLVLSFLLMNISTSFAQSSDIYMVNDIAINASAKSPNDARTKAVNEGQRNALIILFERLGKNQNLAATLSDEQIDDMVSSKQIVDEKIAGNNYSAILNLSFSESFVKYHVGDKSVSKESESKEELYLLIPVKIVKEQMVIWDENNDWKMAFDNLIKSSKLQNIKLAKGDDQDISILNSESIQDADFSDLEDVMNKYKATSIIFAYFDFDSIENKVNIILRTVNKHKIDKVRLDFLNVNQLTMTDLVNKVAAKTFTYIIGNKSESKSSTIATISNVEIDVLINDLGQWLTIKNKLENQNIVFGLKIESISQDMVKIKAIYDGKNGDIVNFFAKHNLYLQKKPEGGYFLSTGQSK